MITQIHLSSIATSLSTRLRAHLSGVCGVCPRLAYSISYLGRRQRVGVGLEVVHEARLVALVRVAVEYLRN